LSETEEAVLRVLVVDDEEPARLLVREHLQGLSGVEVVGEAANGFEAVRTVAELRPDVLFLDVRMPKLDGFEVVELLTGIATPMPAVIFVTAYEEHALQAFRVHAVDYLLKPVERQAIADALERVRVLRRSSGAPRSPDLTLAASAARAGAPLDRVVIRDGAAIHVLAVENIDFVEAKDDYVAFHVGKTAHLKQQTLGEVERLLDPRRFVRVHRSFLVQLERVAKIELYAKDSRIALLRDGRKLPVSRAGYDRLRELL
jgi:two-component system LytT family response regulator